MSNFREVRGAKQLVEDALHHGSRIVEDIQKGTAKRTFDILRHIPVVAPTSRVVESVFDASVSLSHGGIRWVNKAVHRTLDVALDALDESPLASAEQVPEAEAMPSGDDETRVAAEDNRVE